MAGNDSIGLNEAFVVTRTIPGGAASADLDLIAEVLSALHGLDHAGPDDRGRLVVRYDASRVGFAEIERLLDRVGYARPSGLWWRLRAEWFRFTDGNARANAHLTPACCSRPPVAPGKTDD